MILFTFYIVIGIVFVCLDCLLSRLRQAEVWIENEVTGYPKTSKTSWDYTVLDVFLGVVVLLFWPTAIVYGLYDRAKAATQEHRSHKESFDYNYKFWQETLSIAEIEARETVSNPVSTTHNLPFGYLNADWQVFKKKLSPEGMVGSFEALWPDNGPKELIRGYVILDEDGSNSVFVTKRRKLKNKNEFLSLTQNTPPTLQHWKKPRLPRASSHHISPVMALDYDLMLAQAKTEMDR